MMNNKEYQEWKEYLGKSLDLIHKYTQKGLDTFLDNGTDEEVEEHIQINETYHFTAFLSYMGLKYCKDKSIDELHEEVKKIYE